MKYRIHTIKFIISCAMAMFCIPLALYFLVSTYMIAGLVFGAIGCVYVIMAYRLGGVVSVDADGVMAACLFGRKRRMSWRDVRETGVIGLNVFNQNTSNRTGPKYIYFSERILTRDERFLAALKWPPADLIYMRYDLERLKNVRKYWKEPITLYNTGNLVVDPPIKE